MLKRIRNLDFSYDETVKDYLETIYYGLIPYDYRLENLWYTFTCYFKRYTTFKSRYLNHKYHDHVVSLPYTMFEILSDFVESENLEIVNWYSKENSHLWITVNGFKVNALDEIYDLYNWWHKVYIPFVNSEWNETDCIHSMWVNPFEPKVTWIPLEDMSARKMHSEYKSEDYKKRYFAGLDFLRLFESYMEKELDHKLQRLVKIRNLLWV